MFINNKIKIRLIIKIQWVRKCLMCKEILPRHSHQVLPRLKIIFKNIFIIQANRICITVNRIQLQYSQKSFLWHFYITYLSHSLFTFFLFFQQFSLTADITAITFCGNIFAHGADIFTGYNLGSYSGLYRNLELLAWYQLF